MKIKGLSYYLIITLVFLGCAESLEKSTEDVAKSIFQKGTYPDSIQHIINKAARDNKLLGDEAEMFYLRYIADSSVVKIIEERVWNSDLVKTAISSVKESKTDNRYSLISSFGLNKDTFFVSVLESNGISQELKFRFRYYQNQLYHYDSQKSLDIKVD